VLLLLGGCGPASPVALRPDAPTVRRGVFEDHFLLTGALRATRSNSLTTPRTPNWMVSLRWMATEGSTVRAGEPVVQFDTSSIASQLEDKRLAAAEAAASLERTGLDLEAQRREKSFEVVRLRVARDKARLEAQVPAALQALRDHQEKQLALSRAENALLKATESLESFEKDAASQLSVLRLQLEKARRDQERTEALLELLVLKAPADGVLVHGTHPWEGRKWQVGDSCWPGTIVAEVPDLSGMEVEAFLSDVDDGKIAPGLGVRCRLDTYPDRVYTGRIRSISGVAQSPDRNSARRFFTVAIELDRVDPALMRPGMSVLVEVLRRRVEQALLAPRAAVDFSGPEPRLLLRGRQPLALPLDACNPTDCLLDGSVPEGTALELQP
jgi:multidrug resistance efflux pump